MGTTKTSNYYKEAAEFFRVERADDGLHQALKMAAEYSVACIECIKAISYCHLDLLVEALPFATDKTLELLGDSADRLSRKVAVCYEATDWEQLESESIKQEGRLEVPARLLSYVFPRSLKEVFQRVPQTEIRGKPKLLAWNPEL